MTRDKIRAFVTQHVASWGRHDAAYVFTHRFTHVGDILGFPATGRKAMIRGVCLFRLKGGKLASEQRLYDFTELLMQLGILKAKTG